MSYQFCLPAGEQTCLYKDFFSPFYSTGFFGGHLLSSPRSCGSWPSCRGLSQAKSDVFRSAVLLGKQLMCTWNVVICIEWFVHNNQCVGGGRIINMKLKALWALCMYLPGVISCLLREIRDQHNILRTLLALVVLHRIYTSHVLKYG